MRYALQADLVLILHLLYVGFVLIGQLVILVGACLRWKWVRNPWFRWLHLTAMGIVVFEALMGIVCPLTTWEMRLRELAGQDTDVLRAGEWLPEMNIVLSFLRGLLFPGRKASFFIPIYIGFFLIVLFTLVFAPPRWPRLRRHQPKVNVDQSPIAS